MDQPSVTETPPTLPPRKSKPAPGHFRPSRVLARWWWLAALVMIAITAVGYKTPDWLNMSDPLYESTTVLEVKPIPGFDRPASPSSSHMGGAGTGTRATLPFISTQEAIISAQATLELAIKKNDLLNRLGGNPTEALRRMQKSLNVRQKYGTDLIEISYRDEDPILAQDTVTAIYQSYTERRTNLELQVRENEMKALTEELYNKSDRVAELRKRLMKTGEQLGIIWEESDKQGDTQSRAMKLRDLAEKELYEANREKEQLKFQIEKLLTMNDEGDTMLLLLRLPNFPDPVLKKLHEQYRKDREKLKELRAAGLGKEHPDIREREQTTEAIRQVKFR